MKTHGTGNQRFPGRSRPVGRRQGSFRIFRGGGWRGNARWCRAARPRWGLACTRGTYLGFRVALSARPQDDSSKSVKTGTAEGPASPTRELPDLPSSPVPPSLQTPRVETQEFVAPSFPSIEEVTRNWAAIPASLFPREIKSIKNIDFKGQDGTPQPGGRSVFALSQEGASLIVAPARDSPLRGQIGIEDCDIKTIIKTIYEGSMQEQVATAKARFDRATGEPVP